MTDQQIECVPTEYQSIQFRSRLEARWAIFFDTLKIQWQYEPYTYTATSGPYKGIKYTPDFSLGLPSASQPILEVKPIQATNQYKDRIRSLIGEHILNFYFTSGSFYTGILTIHKLNPFGKDTNYSLRKFVALYFPAPIIARVPSAIKQANSYRFDLKKRRR